MVGRIAALGEVRLEQRFFQIELQPFQYRPEQQTVGIEGVVDATVAVRAKRKPDLGAARADHLAIFLGLLRRRAVFFGDVLGDVLSFRAHLRVQFERLETDFSLHLAAQQIHTPRTES